MDEKVALERAKLIVENLHGKTDFELLESQIAEAIYLSFFEGADSGMKVIKHRIRAGLPVIA